MSFTWFSHEIAEDDTRCGGLGLSQGAAVAPGAGFARAVRGGGIGGVSSDWVVWFVG